LALKPRLTELRRLTFMYAAQSKKLLILDILSILKQYSDEEHRLSQKEILQLLKREYGMTADRKAVKRNLMDLMEFGFEIEYSETNRMVKNHKTGGWEETVVQTDYYLVRDFSDSELRLLIDSLLFAKHIPHHQRQALIEKLEKLSSRYFKSRVKHIYTLPDNTPQNKQLFYTIEVLDKAISAGRQVSFTYNSYSTDKKLHPRKNAEGEIRNYIVNPYQIAATNGRYYLICNYDKYDNVGNYRLDRITNIEMLSTPVKPMERVQGLEHGFDLPKHMAEHIYMFAGPSETVTFRVSKTMLNDVIDWFGQEVEFSQETEQEVVARVYVNLQAMRRWALQYAVKVTVLSPKSLVEEVRQDLLAAMGHYGLTP